MIKKTFSKTGKKCRVTFKITPDAPATHVALLGDFNNWNDKQHPMKKRKDGSFSTTLSLDANKTYRFKYLVNNSEWVADKEADGLESNSFGTQDAILNT